MHPYITLDNGRTFTNLVQVFDRGFKVAGPNAPYIGHRPIVSTNPLKFADHFVWSTWGEVAKRRLDAGSGVENLFRSGDAVKANELETVGLWSANTPGESPFHVFRNCWRLPPRAPFRPHISILLTHAHAVFAEWRILDLALSLYGKVVVPLYENFGPDSIGASTISTVTGFQSLTRNCVKSTCKLSWLQGYHARAK